MELANKVVLITGTRRIGAVVAAAVAKRGADVVLLYNRSKGEAEEAEVVAGPLLPSTGSASDRMPRACW